MRKNRLCYTCIVAQVGIFYKYMSLALSFLYILNVTLRVQLEDFASYRMDNNMDPVFILPQCPEIFALCAAQYRFWKVLQRGLPRKRIVVYQISS